MSKKDDIFVGLDISLTSTGYNVVCKGETIDEGSIKTTSDEEWLTRIQRIVDTIQNLIDKYNPTLFVIENYSYDSRHGREVLGEIHGVVMYLLSTIGYRYIKVPPAKAKLFGCGRGNAPKRPEGKAKSTWAKTWVIETINQLYGKNYKLAHNDICDAFILAKLGEAIHMVETNTIDLNNLPVYQKRAITEILVPKTKEKKTSRRK